MTHNLERYTIPLAAKIDGPPLDFFEHWLVEMAWWSMGYVRAELNDEKEVEA